MSTRGMGRVFQPSYTYTDPQNGKKELRTSSVWWIEFSQNGRLHRESSKSRKETAARKLLKTRLGEAGIGKLLPSEVANTTFEDLGKLIEDDYKKNERRSSDQLTIVWKRLAEAFAGMKVTEITSARISTYQAQQKEAGYANATINRDMAALKRAFRIAKRHGLVQEVPHISMLEERNVREGFFEPEEFRAFVKHLPKPLQPLFKVAYITGWRVRSELLTRQWRHVDFVNGKIRIEPGEDKNRSGREFPFTPELKTLLRQQKTRAEEIQKKAKVSVSHVFFWDDGSPVKSYRNGWDEAIEKSGIHRIPHDFRRTAVRNLEIAGVPRAAAMAMVGHKTEAIYRRYMIVDEAVMREGAKKLAALHRQQGRRKSA